VGGAILARANGVVRRDMNLVELLQRRHSDGWRGILHFVMRG